MYYAKNMRGLADCDAPQFYKGNVGPYKDCPDACGGVQHLIYTGGGGGYFFFPDPKQAQPAPCGEAGPAGSAGPEFIDLPGSKDPTDYDPPEGTNKKNPLPGNKPRPCPTYRYAGDIYRSCTDNCGRQWVQYWNESIFGNGWKTKSKPNGWGGDCPSPAAAGAQGESGSSGAVGPSGSYSQVYPSGYAAGACTTQNIMKRGKTVWKCKKPKGRGYKTVLSGLMGYGLGEIGLGAEGDAEIVDLSDPKVKALVAQRQKSYVPELIAASADITNKILAAKAAARLAKQNQQAGRSSGEERQPHQGSDLFSNRNMGIAGGVLVVGAIAYWLLKKKK